MTKTMGKDRKMGVRRAKDREVDKNCHILLVDNENLGALIECQEI
jgi:hypothetical protein